MKALRALMLVLALSACIYAGDMDNGIVSTPPPTPPSATSTKTNDVTGQMETGLTTTNAVTEIALNLLQTALALF